LTEVMDPVPEQFEGALTCRRGASSRSKSAGRTASISGHRQSLRSAARRWLDLQAEVDDLETELSALVTATAPDLVGLPGVGVDTAGQLLVTAGDNPDRLRSEAAFARICGAAPIAVSSGTDRPPVPWRRPRRQQRSLARRPGPHALPPADPGLRGPSHRSGQDQDRDHALPQTLHRPRSLHPAAGRELPPRSLEEGAKRPGRCKG